MADSGLELQSDTLSPARHWTRNRRAVCEFGESLRVLSPGLSVTLDSGLMSCHGRFQDLRVGEYTFSE